MKGERLRAGAAGGAFVGRGDPSARRFNRPFVAFCKSAGLCRHLSGVSRKPAEGIRRAENRGAFNIHKGTRGMLATRQKV